MSAAGMSANVGEAVMRQKLADITNTGRPSFKMQMQRGGEGGGGQEQENIKDYSANILKENTALLQVLGEKNKAIEWSSLELRRLTLALKKANQQNWQLAQAHSQMLTELNTAKDRLKALQHELACTTAILRVKNSELKQTKVTRQQQSEKIIPAVAAKLTQSNLLSNSTCQEAKEGKAKRRKSLRRGLNEPKSESCQDANDLKMEDARVASGSLSGNPEITNVAPCSFSNQQSKEDRRKSLRRRSTRLNPESFEFAGDSLKIEENAKKTTELKEPSFLPNEPLLEDFPSALLCSSVPNKPKEDDKQNDSAASTKSLGEGQAQRRRSSVGRPLRKAAERVVSYKEIPRNVKMRRAE